MKTIMSAMLLLLSVLTLVPIMPLKADQATSSDADACNSQAMMHALGIDNVALLSYAQLNTSIKAVDSQREQIEQILLQQLKPDAPNDVKCAVITLLGSFRSEGAARAISQYITIRYKKNIGYRPDSIIPYSPAVEALGHIGTPAIPFMLDNIRNSDDKEVLRLSGVVIYNVYGARIGKFVLENELASAKDDSTKKHIGDALELYKNISDLCK